MTESPDFLERVERVFHRVRAAPKAQRNALLVELCDGDDALRDEVSSMLSAHEDAGAFLENAPTGTGDDRNVGRTVGAYTLHERIGAGAMGVVYFATRSDGAYEQGVIVKLIRSLAAGEDAQRRFLRERQVLASLQHANIARLLDGGVTPEGDPYLIMEKVAGTPITEHCDANSLRIEDRLALFDDVCAAVQHAHANLVVHRDLKPAHVLVDDEGAVKLLDFGIAAVLDDAGAPVEATITEQRRFTPQYASPEQVTGAPVTTATDVYALGLILYELLSGRRPYRVSGAAPDESRRLICETSPPPPSRRLSSSVEEDGSTGQAIAASRGLDAPRLRRRLTGDLDTIILTALRKDPQRRYGSVEALREDLRRYREGLPISARPESLTYVASRFIRRNRLAVGAVAAVFTALLAGAVTTAWQARVASIRASEAEAALATSDTVEAFLRSILVSADPREGDQDLTVREAMDQAAASLAHRFDGRPAVEARVRETLGATYRTLGDHEKARTQLESAHDLAIEAFGVGDPETATIAHELAVLYLDAGELLRAEELFLEALDARTAALGERHPDTLETRNSLALSLELQERIDEAQTQLQFVVDARLDIAGADDSTTLEAQNNLANVLRKAGRVDEAVTLLETVYEGQARTLGESHPDTLITANDIGATLNRLGRIDEALFWLRRAIDGLAAQYPAGSLDVVIPKLNLARTLATAGRHDEAIALGRKAIDDGAPALGEGHYVVAILRADLGKSLLALGDPDAAIAELEPAHAALLAAMGPENSFTTEAAETLQKAREAASGENLDLPAGG